MQEVFQVGAGDSSSSIKLPSDSIRVVGSNWTLARDNRVQWKDSSQPMGVVAIKGRIRVLNKRVRSSSGDSFGSVKSRILISVGIEGA